MSKLSKSDIAAANLVLVDMSDVRLAEWLRAKDADIQNPVIVDNWNFYLRNSRILVGIKFDNSTSRRDIFVNTNEVELPSKRWTR